MDFLTYIVVVIVIFLAALASVKKWFVLIPPILVAALTWYLMEDLAYTVVAFFVILVLTFLFKD